MGGKKGAKNARKRSRIPDGNGCSINDYEQPPVCKVHHGKKEMKPLSSARNLVKKRGATTEHPSDTKDQADHPPPMKKSKVMVTSCGVGKTPSTKPKDPSKSKSKSGKRKLKIGKKCPLEMVDGDASVEPNVKKSKFLDCIMGEKNHAEFVATIKKMSKSMNPRKLMKDTKDVLADGTIAFSNAFFHPTSREKLIESEKMILKDIKPEGKIIDVKLQCETEIIIHTICFESQNGSKGSKEEKFPLVLFHGFGGGLPVFYKNYSDLSTNRNVYAVDLPGFALSSRVKFPERPEACKQKFVKLLEMWREAMKLKNFILLGHSFGGYLSASYTLKFCSRVRHLILADSWGIIDKSEEQQSRRCAYTRLNTMLNINPFEVIRQTLAVGKILYDKFIPKRIRKAYGDKLVQYFYHANAQNDATGEEAFMCISDEYLWPHTAMKPGLVELDSSVPITFLYGQESEYNNGGGHDVRKKRMNVFVPKPIAEAGHHIQAEKYKVFNMMVNKICDMVDCNTDSCDKDE